MIDPCLPGQLGTQKPPIDTQTLGLDDQGTYKQGLHCRLGWAKITKGLWSKVLINQPLFYSFHLTNASIMLRINKLHCCVFLFKIVVVVLVYVEKYLWDFFVWQLKTKLKYMYFCCVIMHENIASLSSMIVSICGIIAFFGLFNWTFISFFLKCLYKPFLKEIKH